MREIEADEPLALELDVQPAPAAVARVAASKGPPPPFDPHPEVEFALEGVMQGSGFKIVQQLQATEVVWGWQVPNDYFVEPFESKATLRVSEHDGGAVMRNWLGGFRTVTLDVMGGRDICALEVEHRRRPSPFNHTTVRSWNGRGLGTITQRFAWFGTRYELRSAEGQLLGTIERRWFRLFRFDVSVGGRAIGQIEKQWGGLARELYTQADTFLVRVDPNFSDARTRLLILAAGIAIDLIHFERPRHGGLLGLRAARGD